MSSDLFIVIFVIYLLALIVMTVSICAESYNRKGASAGIAFIFTFFLTPIAGLLYLLLFPRKLDTDIDNKKEAPVFLPNVGVPSDIFDFQKTGLRVETDYKSCNENSVRSNGIYTTGDIVTNILDGNKMRIIDIYEDNTYLCSDVKTNETLGVFKDSDIK